MNHRQGLAAALGRHAVAAVQSLAMAVGTRARVGEHKTGAAKISYDVFYTTSRANSIFHSLLLPNEFEEFN